MPMCAAIDCRQPADRTVHWVGDDPNDQRFVWETTFECRYHACESFANPHWVYPGFRPVAVFSGIRGPVAA